MGLITFLIGRRYMAGDSEFGTLLLILLLAALVLPAIVMSIFGIAGFDLRNGRR